VHDTDGRRGSVDGRRSSIADAIGDRVNALNGGYPKV
jgi:hypothetical protein